MKPQFLSTKAQVYTLDLFVALLIITLAVVISFKLVFNTEVDEDFQILQLESRALSDSFLSEGLPANWTFSDVTLPGILLDGRISTNKLLNLQKIGYDNVSGMINARKNFYFYFRNATDIVNISVCGFGFYNDTCEVPEIDARNIVKLDRLAVINSSAIKMVMLVWD